MGVRRCVRARERVLGFMRETFGKIPSERIPEWV
jgi:hypothetical protein